MRVKTVILERSGGKRQVVPKSAFMAVGIHLINIIFSIVLPFVMGFYFARTENFLFFLFLLAGIFFEIRMEYKGDTVKMNVLRLF